MAVSRTRTPTALFPVGGSETDPVSRTNTPSAITKDGSGEPINEKMFPDYDCGDEPGHYFISSPLNIYSIGRSGAVVLYVEGGCPNFTWASDNEWATFETAETSVRYNTIGSTSAEGQDTVVTVTDTNGLEVTINVPWNGAASCCDDPPTLSFQTTLTELLDLVTHEVVIFIDGGCPPFAWGVTSEDDAVALDYAATNSRRNRLSGTSKCFIVTVTDLCEQTASLGNAFCEDTIQIATYGRHPYIQLVSTGLILACYEGTSLVAATGESKSYTISTDCELALVDSLTHDAGTVFGHDSCLIHSGVVATAFQVTAGIKVKALLVAGDGTISQHASNSVVISDGYLRFNVVAKSLGGNYCLITRDSGAGYIYVTSVRVSSEGEVTNPVTDTLQITTTGTQYPQGCMLTDDILFTIWEHGDYIPRARCVNVSDAGALTALTSETTIGTERIRQYSMKKLKAGWIVACATDVFSGNGWLIALEVSSLGAITQNTDFMYEFYDSGSMANAEITVIDSSHIAVFYCEDDPYRGFFSVYKIGVGTTVTWTEVESHDYGGGSSLYPWAVSEVRDHLLAVGYYDKDNKAWIKTRKSCV